MASVIDTPAPSSPRPARVSPALLLGSQAASGTAEDFAAVLSALGTVEEEETGGGGGGGGGSDGGGLGGVGGAGGGIGVGEGGGGGAGGHVGSMKPRSHFMLSYTMKWHTHRLCMYHSTPWVQASRSPLWLSQTPAYSFSWSL